LPGSIYVTSITGSMSETVSNIFCVHLLKFMSEKNALVISFSICLISSVLIVIFENKPDLMPIGVIGIKVGISSAFTYLYIAVVTYFEP
jgi:hypothetical protein